MGHSLWLFWELSLQYVVYKYNFDISFWFDLRYHKNKWTCDVYNERRMYFFLVKSNLQTSLILYTITTHLHSYANNIVHGNHMSKDLNWFQKKLFLWKISFQDFRPRTHADIHTRRNTRQKTHASANVCVRKRTRPQTLVHIDAHAQMKI